MRAFLPEKADLSSRMPRAGDQGRWGSCVGWAVGYAARSYYSVSGFGAGKPNQSQIPSPGYIYNSIKLEDGCDEGSYVSDALRLLKNEGALSYSEFPNKGRGCRRPTSSESEQASAFRIQDYLAVPVGTPDHVKQEIANGHPVVISLQLTKSFDRIGGGIWNPSLSESEDGYHAVTFTGYNERGQYFEFVNSWGLDWGRRGYGRISYKAFNERAQQGYTMRVASTPTPVPPPKPNINIANIELPDLDCSNLELSSSNGTPAITGYVQTEEDLETIETLVQQSEIEVQTDITIVPWPQCETLLTLDEIIVTKQAPEVSLEKDEFQENEALTFSVRMPDFQGYLHVAYIQADGNVVNLVQSAETSIKTIAPGQTLIFGDGKEGRPRFRVSGPFGKEMIIVLASKSPIFETKRELVEIERDFLTGLRKAVLARPAPNDPARLVTAAVKFLETSP